MIGCGGGFLSPPTTQPGNFVVTITGSSGSLHVSTTVTVVVQ
jgi:2-polyprenyl-3-methyl-5-hydroxy-6-metoxy-1,4-benzoquinol methylase